MDEKSPDGAPSTRWRSEQGIRLLVNIMNIPTTEKLARALEQAGAPSRMVDHARRGTYDDFKSNLAFPIVKLVQELEFLGLKELAERARNGEFDSTREEAEEWYNREGQKFLG